MEHTAGRAGTTRLVGRARPVNGEVRQPSPVPLHVVVPDRRPVPEVPRWARVVRLVGGTTIWAVPGYAVAVLITVGRTDRPVLYTAAFGPLALLSVAARLAGGRGALLGATAAVAGIGGSTLLLTNTGVPLPGPHARGLPLAGAALLAFGWLLLGVAGLASRRLVGPGDSVLLILMAVPLAAGGVLDDTVPRLASLLLLAAGLGLCRGVLDPRRPDDRSSWDDPRRPDEPDGAAQ